MADDSNSPILIESAAEREARERAKEQRKDRRQRKLQLWFNGLLLLATVVTVGVVLYQNHILNLTLNEMKIQSAISERAITQSEALAKMGMDHGELLNQRGLTESRNANVVAHRAASAAEAANRLATESFRQEQRADLYVSAFTLAREPDETDPRTVVVLTLRNNGRTAAKAVHNFGSYGYVAGEPPPGDWDSMLELHPTVIYPNGTYQIHIPLIELRNQLTAQPTTADEMKRTVAIYRNRKARIYVRLRTEYLDIFDRKRWAETCVFRVYGQKPGDFTFCDTGNDFSR
jgi:hypothetical protein